MNEGAVMLTQTLETILALFAPGFVRLSALTPLTVAQGFGSVLGILVGIAIPLGMAMTTRKQLERL
jgi:predicted membrane-bound spermidine synthase